MTDIEVSWFPAAPETVGLARDQVASACDDLSEADVYLATLLTSELMTNAVLHGHSDRHSPYQSVGLHVLRTDDRVRVEVFDHHDGRLPPVLPASVFADAGRGLEVVSALASAWGSDRVPGDGKVVWFELRTDATDHMH